METQAQWGLIEPVQRLQDVPTISRSGDYSLALARPIGGGGRNQSVSAADIHLDLKGKKIVTLTFFLRNEADETDMEDAIFFSNDGGKKFLKAFEFDPKNMPDGEYNEIKINIASKAKELELELTDTFIIRFQQTGSKDFAGRSWGDRDGFFVDNISVKE